MSSIRNKPYKNQPNQSNPEPQDILSGFGRSVFFLLPFFLFLISGFCALAYQVLWTRLLILVIDNSVYSFTTILIAFLTGIALGSLLIAPVFRYVKHPVPIFALLEIGIGVSAFCFPFFIHLKQIDPNDSYWAFLLIKMPLVILVPTLLMGITLPLAAYIYQAGKGGVGDSLGQDKINQVYPVNPVKKNRQMIFYQHIIAYYQ